MSLIKFYISQDLKTITNEEAKKSVKKNGGVIREEITNDVWYFVSNNPDSESDDFKKAKKLGILFINEIEFKKMLD